jgi:hypothetical protein
MARKRHSMKRTKAWLDSLRRFGGGMDQRNLGRWSGVQRARRAARTAEAFRRHGG